MKAILAALTILATSTSILAQSMPEQLFLDLIPAMVQNKTENAGAIQPWAGRYISAIADKRYGDAIYARYNISGDYVETDGTLGNTTIEQAILSDAHDYYLNYPDEWKVAMSFYTSNSKKDSRPDIIASLQNINNSTAKGELQVLATTYGISCSGNYLAHAYDCDYIVDHVSRNGGYYYGANVRAVYSYGTCHLRLGPLNNLPDSSARAVQSAAQLISNHCLQRACNGYCISGYSPKNSGHRKICLSSKNSGCS